jgi:hypothetical protein
LAAGNYNVRVDSRAVGYTGSAQGMKTVAYTLTAPSGVVFADANLEAAVRGIVGIPTGTIPVSAVTPITSLDVSNLGITDLTGLQHFTSLTELIANYNGITSVAPISGLTGLTNLQLAVNELSGSLEPFAGLPNLVVLQVAVNQLTGDLSPLASLTALQALSVGDNQLAGTLEPLSSLTSLIGLYGPNNQFTGSLDPLASHTALENVQFQMNPLSGDLSALQGLPHLYYVALYQTSVFLDLAPLVANVNFDFGDTLDAQLAPIDCGTQMPNIAELMLRGANVYTSCGSF